MKIALGADHKGYPLKEQIKRFLIERHDEVLDFGTDSEESCDFPDFGLKVAHAVADGQADYGINICWTGNGMIMAANKVKGVRAGLCMNAEMAELTRLHNDANVLSLASKYVPDVDALEIVETFLTTDFEGGRHIQRLKKITAEE
ncbi:MAG: ribose 5-phosphate isomerase B [candidate division Zixibacteria bacterium]|nr:ribose 5-phosphate isomerase B [candidate division Zixibacteria bacterium]